MTSVRDIIFISILLLVVGIVLVPVLLTGHTINQKILEVSSINETEGVSEIINATDEAMNKTDYIYLLGFIGFFLGIVILGWLMSAHPALSVIYFIIVILFTFISVIFQETWITYSSNAALVATVSTIPITNFILSHLAYFMAVFGLVGILVLFAKPTISEGNY